jgi:hypothetical protein
LEVVEKRKAQKSTTVSNNINFSIMATFKIGALVIRTVAKPLANSLKQQVKKE